MTKKYEFQGTTLLVDQAPPDDQTGMNGYVLTYANTPGISATVRLPVKAEHRPSIAFEHTGFDTRALSSNVRNRLARALTIQTYDTWDDAMTSAVDLFLAIATDLDTIQQKKESNAAWFDGLPDA